jgi:hypothetical protein
MGGSPCAAEWQDVVFGGLSGRENGSKIRKIAALTLILG